MTSDALQPDMIARRKAGVARLSVLSNTVLVVGKFAVGFAIGSVSVISEAIHSSMDLLAAIIAFWAVSKSSKPADKEHPYGHGKFENISGVVEGLLIFVAAGLIIWEAVAKIKSGEKVEGAPWGLAIMGFSAIVNTIVSRKLFKVARETDSVALEADALHLSTDVWTSIGVFVGLGLIMVFDMPILDPIVAILVALLIIREAWNLVTRASGGLIDNELPADELAKIREIINSHKPRIVGFHRLRTRKAGGERQLDFHLVVDGKMTVDESHEICDTIERALRQTYAGTSSVIHVESANDRRRQKCAQES